ncbi:MAG TPA: alpha/beta hydrolase [Chloroflexia bacterium]|jgi:pimeloyl-ACP methyl ester carboxylesterase|nr:alpha/beta hydrolase [Chloroflexia bacterium]
MESVSELQVSGMPTNSGYVEAEARVFGGYALVPAAQVLSLARPRLRLRAVEVGTGEPVLFLHGWGLCTAHWAPLVSRLAGVHSLMLDAPGHGVADAVDFRGVDLRAWYKEMLTGCLDALGLAQVRLIGHSQGAMQALWLALDAPTRVRSVIAIGTPAVAFGAPVAALRVLARPGLGRVLLSLPVPPPAYRNLLAGNMGPAAVRAYPELVRATYLATHRSGFARTVSSYLSEMFRGADAEPPRYVLSDAELRRISQPVLVLWGKEDTRFQPIEDAKARAALLPHGRFEVVSGDHEPWLNDLEACTSLIAAFHSGQRIPA